MAAWLYGFERTFFPFKKRRYEIEICLLPSLSFPDLDIVYTTYYRAGPTAQTVLKPQGEIDPIWVITKKCSLFIRTIRSL